MKSKTKNKTAEDSFGGNAFTRMINTHRRGVVAAAATEKLTECMEASRERGLMSTMTITFKFKPQNDDQILIEADVTNKIPQEKLPAGMMYLDENNCLHVDDPKQRMLPLREVEKDETIHEVESSREIREA